MLSFRGRPALVALAALCLPVVAAVAQVGYLPEKSPFREIRFGQTLELQGGQLFGNGGPIKVGPQDGSILGARMNFRGQHSLQLSLGGWTAGATRYIVDADKAPATRVSGPIKHRLIGGEFTLQLNLTGGKSWHSLAPYAGLGLGLVHGAKTPAADTSGYSFGTKLYFAPNVGTRLMLGQRFFVKAEARAYFWNLKYPNSYADEPAQAPGTSDAPNAVNPSGKGGEYTPVPALLFGFGIKF
jgi:hypothetical protein